MYVYTPGSMMFHFPAAQIPYTWLQIPELGFNCGAFDDDTLSPAAINGAILLLVIGCISQNG